MKDRHYPPDRLAAPADCAIDSEDRAAYRMAAVIADGRASSGNVALLKQALEIYPGVHDEIRGI